MPATNHNNYANDSSAYMTFNIPGEDVYKWYLQDFKLPNISIPTQEVSFRGVKYKLPGQSITFEEVNLSFIVDEQLSVYLEMLDAIKKLKDWETLESDHETLTQATIFVQDNNHNNIVKFDFDGVWFSEIGGPTFSTKGQETKMNVDVTMVFQGFSWEKLV